jgi:hypothetical protein
MAPTLAESSGVGVLAYAADVSGVLSLLLALPGTWVSARKWLREHRSRYCPRHARPRRFPGRRGRHELRTRRGPDSAEAAARSTRGQRPQPR